MDAGDEQEPMEKPQDMEEDKAEEDEQDKNRAIESVKKLCEETGREWHKNIRRKLCDAFVVTEGIAEHSIKLLREQSMKGPTNKASTAAAAADKAKMEKLAEEVDMQAIAKQRYAAIVNKATLTVLEKLMSHKWSWLFNEPVDVEQLKLKDYHKIIKNPMALSTVKSRAQIGYYKTAEEAASDIRLVFNNAQLYNKAGTDVNIMACALLEKFEDLWHTKVIQKFHEEENLAKQEETIALKKKADALRAQENNIFRQKCQSYEKLLCDVEGFIVDLQQQIIVSCKPLASEKRKRAQTLIQRTPFEKMKPALSIILQRYPEMLNSITREVELDLSKVDSLTLRQVLMLLEKVQDTDVIYPKMLERVEKELNFWISTMSLLVKVKRRRTPQKEQTSKDEGKGIYNEERLDITT